MGGGHDRGGHLAVSLGLRAGPPAQPEGGSGGEGDGAAGRLVGAGGGDPGEGGAGSGAVSALCTGRPHDAQNLAPGASGVPQPLQAWGSALGRAVPQLVQNLAPGELTVPHFGQTVPWRL